jgi:hypothetical protein
MKHKLISCLLLIFSLTFLFTACQEDAEDEIGRDSGICEYCALFHKDIESMNMPRPEDSYNYPVYPGMDTWSIFSTGQQMAQACQVPAKIVKKQSTQALIQAIWEYPLLLEVFHRSQYQLDFEATLSNHNAYRELTNRKDAAQCLLERLDKLNPLIPESPLVARILELVISQPVFLSQLNSDKKKKLLEITLEKDSQRQEDIQFANGLLRNVAGLLVGRVLVNVKYQSFTKEVNANNDLKLFLESEKGASYNIEQIFDHANNFLNSLNK